MLLRLTIFDLAVHPQGWQGDACLLGLCRGG